MLSTPLEHHMPDLAAPVKLGVNGWNQYTKRPSFFEARQRADCLGFHSLRTRDQQTKAMAARSCVHRAATLCRSPGQFDRRGR